MRLRRLLWIAPAVLAACADYSAPDSVTSGVVVYTQPQAGFDFKTGLPAHYFYVDPNVPWNNNGANGSTTLPSAVQSAIVSQLVGYGWTQTTTQPYATGTAQNPRPDVAINAGIFVGSSNVYYPGYWCGYYPYYYGCWYGGWYYAGTYTIGTVTIEMVDVTGSPSATANVRWAAAEIGTAYTWTGGTTIPTSAITAIVDSTNRAFGQSPYLDVH